MTRETSALLVIIVLIIGVWAIAGGRPLFRSSTGQDIKAAVQDAGQDIKSTGRDAADAIRRTVQ